MLKKNTILLYSFIRSQIKKCFLIPLFAKNAVKMSFLIRKTNSVERLRKLRSSHNGEIFFVVGAGPSLKDIDLDILSGKNVISHHFAFQAFKNISLKTHYWVVGAESRMRDLKNINRKQFTASIWSPGSLKRRRYPFEGFSENDIIIPPVYDFQRFRLIQHRGFVYKDGKNIINKSLSCSSPPGCTAVVTGIQLAYYLGAKTIVLLGADFGRSSEGTCYFSNDVPIVDSQFLANKDVYKTNYPGIRTALSWYKNFLKKQGVEVYNASSHSRDDVLERKNVLDFL